MPDGGATVVGGQGCHIGATQESPFPKAAYLRTQQRMTRRSPRSRAYAPDPGAPGCACDMPGCGIPGGYRAPRSRTSLNEYWWFCLDHVRAYNAKWDFYKGMSPAQIELQLRADTSWQRPTWPLGHLGAAAMSEEALRDPLSILAALHERPRRGAADRAPADRAPANRAPAELREPLATLGLGWPVTMAALKTRYHELAKRHHPDANNGDQAAEERLKLINLAYAALRGKLAGEPRMAAAG